MRSRYLPATVMGLAAFIATFDVTAVSLALPDIGRTFELDVARQVLVMNVYSLALTVMLVGAGAICDRYGHRLSVLAGATTFLVASLLCAYASNYATLVGGRVIQGIAAAFIVCGGYALIGRLYTEKAERVRAFAIIGTVGGSALAIGPGLGGVITSTLGWQWVFLMNIPVCLAIIAGTLTGMRESRGLGNHRLDVLGIILFSVVLLMSAWSLLYGPAVGGLALRMPAFLTVVALALGAFVWVESKASVPVIDISLFRRKTFLGLAAVPLCLAVSYWSLIVFIPLFLESSHRFSTRHISYIMLFFTVPMFVVPYLVTRIATRSKQSTFFFAGMFLVAVGCLGISMAAYSRHYGVAIAAMTVAGAGAAAIQTQVSGALIASAPEDRAGAVSAIMTVLRQGGFAVGSASLGNVLVVRSSQVDSFALLFAVCAVVAGVGSAFTYFLVRSDENKTRERSDRWARFWTTPGFASNRRWARSGAASSTKTPPTQTTTSSSSEETR